MSHLSASAPAVALGACVGLAAGLHARRAVHRTASLTGPNAARQTMHRFLLLVVIVGVGFGVLVGARFGMSACLPAYLYLVAIAPVLGAADAATKRLPNRVLLPAYPAVAVLLAFAAWRASDTSALWRAAASGMVLYVLFLAVALVAAPGSLGFGDVKLAGLLGIFLGFSGWATTWLGMAIAFASAALYIAVRPLVQRQPSREEIPLGPALLFGTLVAVILG